MKINILNIKIRIIESGEESLNKAPVWGIRRFKWQGKEPGEKKKKERNLGIADSEGPTGKRIEEDRTDSRHLDEGEKGKLWSSWLGKRSS